MKYEYQIQVKELGGDKWFTIYHTFESLLMCRRKVDELRGTYAEVDFRIMYRLIHDWDCLEEYNSEVEIIGKELAKEQYYAQKELNEIYYKKCYETGDVNLLSKCKIIIEKGGKYWEI